MTEWNRRQVLTTAARFTLAISALAVIAHGLPYTADAVAPPLAPRLPDLLRGSAQVVLADVGAVTEHDEGRLLQAHLRVGRAFKGADGQTAVKVIEERRFPSVPSVLRTGRRVIAFLQRATMTSQLRRALPEGTYYKLMADRWGLIDLPDAATESAVVAAVGGWAALARDQDWDEAEKAAALRRLVFSELAATHERLVEDGTGGLTDLSGLAGNLTAAEQDIITGVLNREDLPERVRIALVDAIAQMGLRSLAPALGELPGASPELLRASIAARARLGAARKSSDLVAAFKDDDPAARMAAVHEFIESGASGASGEIADLAINDPVREVRLAAIEALERAASPEALQALGETFCDTDLEIRRRSAQAIHEIGGREAARLLSDLAFTAPKDAQKQAVLMLLALGVSREDPLVTRIRDTHPDQSIRNLAAHGISLESR